MASDKGVTHYPVFSLYQVQEAKIFPYVPRPVKVSSIFYEKVTYDCIGESALLMKDRDGVIAVEKGKDLEDMARRNAKKRADLDEESALYYRRRGKMSALKHRIYEMDDVTLDKLTAQLIPPEV
jgi:hypothetical protein